MKGGPQTRLWAIPYGPKTPRYDFQHFAKVHWPPFGSLSFLLCSSSFSPAEVESSNRWARSLIVTPAHRAALGKLYCVQSQLDTLQPPILSPLRWLYPECWQTAHRRSVFSLTVFFPPYQALRCVSYLTDLVSLSSSGKLEMNSAQPSFNFSPASAPPPDAAWPAIFDPASRKRRQQPIAQHQPSSVQDLLCQRWTTQTGSEPVEVGFQILASRRKRR